MVQVLPYIPSFGERLAQVAGQVVGDVGSTLVQKHFQNKESNADRDIIANLRPDSSPIELLHAYGTLSKQGQANVSPILQQLIRGQTQENIAGAKAVANQQAEEKKSQEAQEKQKAELAGVNDTLQWLKDNVGYTGTTGIFALGSKSFGGGKQLAPGVNSPAFNREAVEKRQQYKSAGFLLADKIFTKFNKGTISKDKLKIVQQLAPDPEVSERENLGRIAALEKMMALPPDIGKKEFDKQLQEKVREVKESPVKVVSPSGKIVEIPESEVSAALKAGGKLP